MESTTSFDLYQAAEAFFTEFNEAFETFDGCVVAERYVAPYLAVGADGSSEVFPSREAISQYFQQILDEYHRRGCRSCQHKDLQMTPVGSKAAFATVTWELLCEEGGVVTTWRESYNLVSSDHGFKTCASMDHAN